MRGLPSGIPGRVFPCRSDFDSVQEQINITAGCKTRPYVGDYRGMSFIIEVHHPGSSARSVFHVGAIIAVAEQNAIAAGYNRLSFCQGFPGQCARTIACCVIARSGIKIVGVTGDQCQDFLPVGQILCDSRCITRISGVTGCIVSTDTI